MKNEYVIQLSGEGWTSYVTEGTSAQQLDKARIFETEDDAHRFLAICNDMWRNGGKVVTVASIKQKKDSKRWIPVTERLPTLDVYGPYPTVNVIVQCIRWVQWRDLPAIQHVVQGAELRFIGGDENKPFWQGSASPHKTIENDSWFVTHWRAIDLDLPEPVADPASIFKKFK